MKAICLQLPLTAIAVVSSFAWRRPGRETRVVLPMRDTEGVDLVVGVALDEIGGAREERDAGGAILEAAVDGCAPRRAVGVLSTAATRDEGGVAGAPRPVAGAGALDRKYVPSRPLPSPGTRFEASDSKAT